MRKTKSPPYPKKKFSAKLRPCSQLSTDFEKGDNVCVCYADNEYSADEQVFIFYGVRTNADFLVHNGFVYPDNEHDAVKIRLGVSRSDPLYSLRYRLLQTLSLPALAEFYLTLGPFPIDGKLLAFVRIFNMDQSKTLEKPKYRMASPDQGGEGQGPRPDIITTKNFVVTFFFFFIWI